MKRGSGDLQERIVQLYFVRGWTVRSICERYGLGKAMAHKLLAEWRIRAIESGYIQEIEQGTLAGLIGEANAGVPAHAADEVAPPNPFVYVDTVGAPIPPAVENSSLAGMAAGSGV